MSYGLQVFNPSGTKVFDTTRYGGVFIEFIEVLDGTSGSRTYPAFTGRTIFVATAYNNLANTTAAWNCWSVSYPSGVPTLTWSYPATNSGSRVQLMVFIR